MKVDVPPWSVFTLMQILTDKRNRKAKRKAETSLWQNKTRPRWFRSGAKRGTTTGKMEGKLPKKWRSRESPSGGEGVGGIERKWFF